MPQCAKCGKVVKYKILSYGIWKCKESFPEFYDKPLCNSCFIELDYARRTETEALCEHLRLLGLDATVESKKREYLGRWEFGTIIGSVRVANRNIDSVEMWWNDVTEEGWHFDYYRCIYVVQANVKGLEDKLKAHTRQVRKGFLFRVVDFEWKGKELAQVLNNDADVRKTLYPLIAKYRGHSHDLPRVEIKPYRKHQCVRISPHPRALSPAAAFPTIESFETYDRIAHHIRSIANVRP